MDVADTIIPRSDQINAEDLIAGNMTVTITAASRGNSEQPVNLSLAEIPNRVYRPGKSMLRVMSAAWGTETDAWIGQRLTLFCDPSVKWGGTEVGGVRIAAMSGITAPLKLALTVTRGTKKPFVVQPLPDAPDVIPPSTKDQQQRIRDLLADVDDKAGRVSAIVGRTVATVRDLDTAEASALINALEQGEGTA